MLETGEQCLLEDIYIGDVFAHNTYGGGWQILYKPSRATCIILTDTGDTHTNFYEWLHKGTFSFWARKGCYLYKLPEEVQNLWRTPWEQ